MNIAFLHFLKSKKLSTHAISNVRDGLAGRRSVLLLIAIFLVSIFATRSFANTYATWKSQVFTTADQANPLVSGETANPSGDGISNLEKYAFGLNPYQSALTGKSTTSPIQQNGDSYLTLTYQVPSGDPPTDLLYIPQVSTNLVNWSSTVSLFNTQGPTNGFNFYTYIASTLPRSQNPKAFMRLQLTETILVNLASGNLNSPQAVTLTGPQGTLVYYTIDGTTPTKSSILYSGPISVSSSQTIKAQAYSNGNAYGGITVANYSLDSTAYPPPSGAPTAPSNLTATSTSGEVDLSWTNNATNASDILVQQQNSDGSWNTVATLNPSQNTDAVNGLTSGSSFTFRIVALNVIGQTSLVLPNPVTVLPPSRYAVIDLGAKLIPKKITNSGYVLLYPPGPVLFVQPPSYRWANGVPTPLQTQAPATVALGTDIAEDGSVVGTQTAYPANYIPHTGNFGIWSLTTWAGTASAPTSVSFAPVAGSDVNSNGYSIWEGSAISSSASGLIIYSVKTIPTDPSNVNTARCEFENSTQLSSPFNTFPNVTVSLVTANNLGNAVLTDSTNFFMDNGQSLPAGFTPTAISNTGNVWGNSGGGIGWWDGATLHANVLPKPFSATILSVNAATAVINGTTYPATQVLSQGSLWEMNPQTGIFGNPTPVSDLIASNSGWALPEANYINDSGIIVGTAEKASDGYASHALMLLLIQSRVATRDDPTQTWANNVLQTGLVPVYAGITAGDMVSWTVPGTASWLSGTFTWTVTDTNGNPVTDQNGTTIAGPSGVGINEWRIATWTAGGNDPNNQWLMWKPGIYNITCTISFSGGGTIPITFQQQVGQRTKDVVVIGWIDESNVPLSTSGVDGDVLSYFPSTGSFSGFVQQSATTLYLGEIATGSTQRPLGGGLSLSATDEIYILNWMFKFAGNPPPPNSFSNEAALDAFNEDKTNYKLFNRLQLKYLVSGSFFAGPVKFTLPSSMPRTDIGNTIDPIWGTTILPHPGTPGLLNGQLVSPDNSTIHLINEGSPAGFAVNAFNTLMAPLKWNDIGSRIDEGVPLDRGAPPGYTIENQIYPTYYIYERASDGGFYLMKTISQAPLPSMNFNSNPYCSVAPIGTGPAPFLLPQ